MKILSVGKNMFSMVDDEDYEKFKDFNFSIFPHGRNFYARRSIYDKELYKLTKKSRVKHLLLHREILGLTDPKISVDHADGNCLNNQKSNLRICSCSQNMWNRQKNKNGTSKYKGVNFHKRDKVFAASIGINGKRKWLGYYDNEIEAALAYNVAASFAFKEFARLNVI